MFKHGSHYVRREFWKKEVLLRDGGKCLSCEAKFHIVVRHILSPKKYPGIAYDIDNGVSLCAECYEWINSGKDYEQICRSLILDRKFKNAKKEKFG